MEQGHQGSSQLANMRKEEMETAGKQLSLEKDSDLYKVL